MHSRLRRLLVEYHSLFLFIGLMLVFRSAVADWMYVPSGSMNPTLIEGDRIVVDKEAYGLRIPFTTIRLTHGADPQRGDIVIFPSPEDGMTLVKRVIGLPGDVVQMQNEQLSINGKPVEYAAMAATADADLPRVTRTLDHDYLREDLPGKSHPIMLLPNRHADRSFGPMTVPAGKYLVLGDNRDNSKDSRYIGFVPRESIVGRAFAVAWSLDADRWYRPRGDRFVKTLR
ncbi:MAG: signal peptidase I [Xanthomonadales bacterium PRO7]|jgi:signal peptidase I|nr:signal peptidase I [Xanthomonadales bacterium PRO7]HMM56844.1 signal peptidase I [Rudaea sp.]